ncbi:GNAT family N-acetyltransferase [Leptolyngbya sp. GGD]|uniref:GNAT family N-acetyltransferase n=1 Tax=Leptolyngbya sp. GGD TaxID=2997907 RepID=UPI00227AC34A|nr:GNAT family N-acetyltransferase [Leptolyngbya sp. GGD]MCY6493631.1 GNAT family N-acetyltransferase [Leptolyngbya sp. GGD]
MSEFLPGYVLERGSGSGRDRDRLLTFMQNTYTELFPGRNFPQLESAIARFFSAETPLQWVQCSTRSGWNPIAGLWLGSAIEQGTGERQTHILLLYVMPEHRRKGIGAALVRYAETWAKMRGDRQIGLQVFETNLPALSLYQALGYGTQSRWMTKSID